MQLLGVLGARADRPATSRHPDIRLKLREGPGADALLMVCNYNPREAVTAPVTIHRRVMEARDLCTPTGTIVPLERKGGVTQLTARLEPGEWTVIRLRD
jgi:hypothetical protein